MSNVTPLRKDQPKTTLSQLELRRQITKKVDVLGNLIDVANGHLPDSWRYKADGSLKDDETIAELEKSLNFGRMLEANYKLLTRLMPELKSIELADGGDDKDTGYEAARVKFLQLMERKVAAANESDAGPGGDISGPSTSS